MIPYYIGLEPYGFYEWGIYTVPQDQLDGVSRHIPMGKGVGGGSLINGMVWNRGNQESYNAWNTIGDSGWDWAALLPYFQRVGLNILGSHVLTIPQSETYTPKSYSGAVVEPSPFNASVHGSSGPVQVSYPNYLWPQTSTRVHHVSVPE